jgi:hypothetical protein
VSAIIDLVGKNFGSLTVNSRAASVAGRAAWTCTCECGSTVVAKGHHLRRSYVTSCGCVKVERAKRLAQARVRHGKTSTPEFRTWTAMISRCTNPNDYRFKRYGARGITVCAEWMESFERFLADVGPIPFPGAELDREKNNLGYAPGNVRWTTSKVNNNNRSSNRYIDHNGITRTLTQRAEQFGLNSATLRVRLESGWSVERALTQPVRRVA